MANDAKAPRDGGLCPETSRLVRSFTSPVQIEVYVTTGEPRLDAFVKVVREVLERAGAAGGALGYRVNDVAGPDALDAARQAGLHEHAFDEGAKGAGALVPRVLGLVVRYRSETDTIRALPIETPGRFELRLASTLRRLRDRVERKQYAIGVLRGHGELELGERFLPQNTTDPPQSIATALGKSVPQYRFVGVDLAGGAKEVDAALDGLLVLQPARDLTEDELRTIDRFVMRGKGAAIVASAVNVRKGDKTMHATLSTHGLERLTLGYGVELRNDVVIDLASRFETRIIHPSGDAESVSFPAFVDVPDAQLDPRSSVFFDLPGAIFPFASSLVLHEGKQPPGALRIVARTSSRTLRKQSVTVDLSLSRTWEPEGELSSQAVAATATGMLRSAFDPAITALGPAHVLVIASSQFLANPLMHAADAAPSTRGSRGAPGGPSLEPLAMTYAQERGATILAAAEGILGWMVEDDALARCALTR